MRRTEIGFFNPDRSWCPKPVCPVAVPVVRRRCRKRGPPRRDKAADGEAGSRAHPVLGDGQKKAAETFVYLPDNSLLCTRFRAIAVRTRREKSLICCVVTITI